MGSGIHGQQPLFAYMSVDLCCLETGVTQQFLHNPQVSAPVQQMGGEAVAERMGVGGHRRPAVEHPPYVPGPEAVAPPVEEQGVDWAFCRAQGGPGPPARR